MLHHHHSMWTGSTLPLALRSRKTTGSLSRLNTIIILKIVFVVGDHAACSVTVAFNPAGCASSVIPSGSCGAQNGL